MSHPLCLSHCMCTPQLTVSQSPSLSHCMCTPQSHHVSFPEFISLYVYTPISPCLIPRVYLIVCVHPNLTMSQSHSLSHCMCTPQSHHVSSSVFISLYVYTPTHRISITEFISLYVYTPISPCLIPRVYLIVCVHPNLTMSHSPSLSHCMCTPQSHHVSIPEFISLYVYTPISPCLNPRVYLIVCVHPNLTMSHSPSLSHCMCTPQSHHVSSPVFVSLYVYTPISPCLNPRVYLIVCVHPNLTMSHSPCLSHCMCTPQPHPTCLSHCTCTPQSHHVSFPEFISLYVYTPISPCLNPRVYLIVCVHPNLTMSQSPSLSHCMCTPQSHHVSSPMFVSLYMYTPISPCLIPVFISLYVYTPISPCLNPRVYLIVCVHPNLTMSQSPSLSHCMCTPQSHHVSSPMFVSLYMYTPISPCLIPVFISLYVYTPISPCLTPRVCLIVCVHPNLTMSHPRVYLIVCVHPNLIPCVYLIVCVHPNLTMSHPPYLSHCTCTPQPHPTCLSHCTCTPQSHHVSSPVFVSLYMYTPISPCLIPRVYLIVCVHPNLTMSHPTCLSHCTCTPQPHPTCLSHCTCTPQSHHVSSPVFISLYVYTPISPCLIPVFISLYLYTPISPCLIPCLSHCICTPQSHHVSSHVFISLYVYTPISPCLIPRVCLIVCVHPNLTMSHPRVYLIVCVHPNLIPHVYLIVCVHPNLTMSHPPYLSHCMCTPQSHHVSSLCLSHCMCTPQSHHVSIPEFISLYLYTPISPCLIPVFISLYVYTPISPCLILSTSPHALSHPCTYKLISMSLIMYACICKHV